jgi:hypothetical protein
VIHLLRRRKIELVGHVKKVDRVIPLKMDAEEKYDIAFTKSIQNGILQLK